MNDRAHIPEFFKTAEENEGLSKGKIVRFLTPLPREKQNLEINFLEDLLKDRRSVQHISMSEKQELYDD